MDQKLDMKVGDLVELKDSVLNGGDDKEYLGIVVGTAHNIAKVEWFNKEPTKEFPRKLQFQLKLNVLSQL